MIFFKAISNSYICAYQQTKKAKHKPPKTSALRHLNSLNIRLSSGLQSVNLLFIVLHKTSMDGCTNLINYNYGMTFTN